MARSLTRILFTQKLDNRHNADQERFLVAELVKAHYEYLKLVVVYGHEILGERPQQKLNQILKYPCSA